MSTTKMFFAGSGGQGILMMGQMTTYVAMMEDREATFLPSYGPEMRGGTANCTVVTSDKPISCPLIFEADIVVAMNQPSLIKFESLVKPGGKLFINSSIIDYEVTRTDIEVYKVAANEIATGLGNPRAVNMVMLGEIVKKADIGEAESFEKVIKKTFSKKGEKITELNLKAFRGI